MSQTPEEIFLKYHPLVYNGLIQGVPMTKLNNKKTEISKKRDELRKLDQKYGPSLAKLPHPRGFGGKSLRDSINYALSIGGITSITETIRAIRKHETNKDLELPSSTDGYIVAYGKTYGFNDRFQAFGFSLRKFGDKWAWYRETLSDKVSVWQSAIEQLGPGIETLFVKQFEQIGKSLVEASQMDREFKSSSDEVLPHEHDGAIFEVSKWYSMQFKENHNTQYAFRNLKILKVKAESAKAYLVDAEFFSGIASCCGVCGMQLNNDISRATGIGPVCAGKIGLPRPTMAKAKMIVAELESLSKAQGTFRDVWVPKSQIKNIIKAGA